MSAGPSIVVDGLKVQVDFGAKKTYNPIPTATVPIALDSTSNIINTAPNTGNVLGNASPISPYTYYSCSDIISENVDGEPGLDVYHQTSDIPTVTSTNAGSTTPPTGFGTRKINSLVNGSDGINGFKNGWEVMVIGNFYYLEHPTNYQYDGFFKYVGREAVTWNPGNTFSLLGAVALSDTTIYLNTPNEFALYPGDILEVNNEKMRVESWSNALGSGDVWSVTRGVEGTAIGVHALSVTVYRRLSTYLYQHYFEWVASHNKFQRGARVDFNVLPVNNSVAIYPAEKVGKWGNEGHCIANEYNWSSGNPADGYVTINHNQNYVVSRDPFTIEIWFRMRELPVANLASNTPIYGGRIGTDYMLYCFPKEFDGRSALAVCYDDSSFSSSHKSQYRIGEFEWVQFVHMHTPFNTNQGQFEYYINGELDTPLTNSSDVNGFSVPNIFGIGHDFRWDVQSRVDMAIIRHYNRKLTASEIRQNFNAHRGRFGL